MPIQKWMGSRTFPAFIALTGAAVVAGACATSGARPEAFPKPQPATEVNSSGTPPSLAPAPAVVLPTILSSAVSPAAAVIQTALSLVGTPYRFGGDSPDTGFDCSGFVGYVLRQHSIALPRTVVDQFTTGQAIAQSDVRPGDLVFFSTTGPGATHVGLVVSNGPRWEFVHAPADGSTVRIERFDTGYWQQRWIGARRVF